MLTDEQRLLRQSGIGASEIASVMGLNPFCTALDLYIQKTNPISQTDDLANNEAVIFGNLFEAPILSHYEKITGNKIVRSDTLIHPQYPFLLATPDALVEGQSKGVEVKTIGEFSRKRWEQNRIPYSFLLQCQQNLMVTGLDMWDLVVVTGGQKLEMFEIKNDLELQKIIIQEASKFWLEHVKKLSPPAADYNAPNILEAMKKLYNHIEDGAIVELGHDVDSIISDWLRAKENIKVFTAVEKVSQAKLLEKLGNNAVGKLSNGSLITRKHIKRKGYTVADSEYITLNYKSVKDE